MHRQIYIRLRVISLVLTTGVVLFLSSCSGSCNRQTEDNNSSAVQSPVALQEDVTDILSHPVNFDEQSISETLNLVTLDRELTSAEAARAIVITEAGVNHLSQVLESLIHNEDDADSWHILTELKQKSWPFDLIKIADALDNHNLDGYARERLSGINKSITYIKGLSESIHSGNNRLPQLFTES